MLLDNVRNHVARYEFDPLAPRAVIVAHPAGIRFFLRDLQGTPGAGEMLTPDLAKRMAVRGGHSVEILLCRFTRPDRALAASWIRTNPSGIAMVAALQAKGSAHVKVG